MVYMNTVILTGGGTAGHVTPALALVPELKKRFDKIVFIGAGGIEKRLAENAGLPFFAVTCGKLDRSKILNNFKTPFLLAKGIKEATEILRDLKPSAVFSKGGFAAMPTCFAAKKLGIPVVCHESDFSLGLANRMTKKFASEVVTSFVETKGGVFLGNPVREEILKGDRTRAMKTYPIDPTKKTVLIFGGSLGAAAINNVVYKSLPILTKKYNVLHISGKSGDFSVKAKNYFQIEFTNAINDCYALCDVVVSRGGANALSEIAALGKRCIVIPLPKGASRGDQEDNAKSYAKRGFVTVLLQEDLFVESLCAKIDEALLTTPKKLDVSKVNKDIVDLIVNASTACK